MAGDGERWGAGACVGIAGGGASVVMLDAAGAAARGVAVGVAVAGGAVSTGGSGAVGGSMASVGTAPPVLAGGSRRDIAVEMIRSAPTRPATNDTASTPAVTKRRLRSCPKGSRFASGRYSIAAEPRVAELAALGDSP